nr:MAG TPA_asm: hypothetical protein [Caudoviricetes sp.]
MIEQISNMLLHQTCRLLQNSSEQLPQDLLEKWV